MKNLQFIILFLFFHQILLAQDIYKEKQEPTNVISLPTGSVKKQIAGPFVIENYDSPIQVTLSYKEYNKLSLIDSCKITSFYLARKERTKFEVSFSIVEDKIFVGLERRNEPEIGRIIFPEEDEKLKIKLYPIQNPEKNKEMSLALIYPDSIAAKLETDEKFKNQRDIYSQLSHFYIIYYNIKEF
jgi:hypothetical protein